MLWSADFANAAWGKPSTTATPGVPDPKGGNNAQTLTTSAPTVYTTQILTASTSLVRTNSLWMRRRTGSGGIFLLGTDSSEVPVALTSNYQRFSATGIATTARVYGIRINTSGDAIDVFEAQMDDGPVATQNIHTTSAPVTVNPSFYPLSADAFEPVFDVNFVPAIPQIFVDGVLKTQGTDYTISSAGLVTFTVAPAAGAALTWSGSYYWRVRFDLDQTEFNNFLNQLWEAKKVTLVSVKAA
jgi:hypothetical protein